MIEYAFIGYLLLAGLGIIAMFCRLARGPSAADRLNCADLIGTSCVALIVAQGAVALDASALDIGLIASLVLFFGTTLVATLWNSPGEVDD